jgi:hypothetical protein
MAPERYVTETETCDWPLARITQRTMANTLLMQSEYSIPQRNRLHFHPSSPRRRPKPLRTRLGALVSHPERGEDPHLCHEHACRAE